MKPHRPRIVPVIVLVVFCFSGIAVVGLAMARQDARNRQHKLMVKGHQLASLIPLYPLKQFQGQDGDYFLRTLTEYDLDRDIAYLFIHDTAGKAIISLSSVETARAIPSAVKSRSLNTAGLLKQEFETTNGDRRLFEFTKPIFQGADRVGVVRLGLELNQTNVLSSKRLQMLSMVAFFIIAAMLVSYYGIIMALKPVRGLIEKVKNSYDLPPESAQRIPGNGQVMPLISGLRQSVSQMTDRLALIETDNIELKSKVGVSTFQKNQMSQILDAVDFGILITDAHDNITHINDYMTSLFHLQRDKALDHPLQSVFTDETLLDIVAHLDQMAASHNRQAREISIPDLAPGETFNISCSYLSGPDRVPIGKKIFLTNISDEKQSDTAKQDFITHVAHELMTPLTNIKSYSEMLMDGEVDDLDMQKEFYNTINEQTTRLSTLIKDLLNVSKMEAGSLTLKKGLVRTDWFVEACLTSIEATVEEKNITLQRDLPDVFPALMADKDLLKAAVINLLGNAAKYTPPNGSITFAIGERKDMVVFDIIDTGYGISPDELPHVFEKFYRSENPQVTEETGSGLGLAITAEIVQLHGGDIDVKSELGSGTHVSIKIPREDYTIGTS